MLVLHRRGLAAILTIGAALICAAPAAARTISLTLSANGRTIHLHTGDTLKITLPEVRDAGYSWRTLTPPRAAVLRRLSSAFIAPKLKPGQAGGEGHRLERYRAAGTGRTRVALGYIPPGSTAPANRFTVTVVVG